MKVVSAARLLIFDFNLKLKFKFVFVLAVFSEGSDFFL